jgi:hypothetical protein
MHDKGSAGVQQARDFMNLFSRLRSKNPRVRWLVTGSIGIDPLAKAGNYIGVMSKFTNIELEPLTEAQSIAYLHDLAQLGALQDRTTITPEEAAAIVNAVGWRVAFYLEVFAQHISGPPATGADQVKAVIDAAMTKLISPHQAAAFGTWEEHIQKHYPEPQRKLSFAVLNELAKHESGLDLDALMPLSASASLDRDQFQYYLQQLVIDGFLYQDDAGTSVGLYRFRIALLRLWWKKFPAQP